MHFSSKVLVMGEHLKESILLVGTPERVYLVGRGGQLKGGILLGQHLKETILLGGGGHTREGVYCWGDIWKSISCWGSTWK